MYYIGIYRLNIIDSYTFLSSYPLDAIIPDEIYAKLIFDTDIYGLSLNEKVAYLNVLRRSLHLSGRRKYVLHLV